GCWLCLWQQRWRYWGIAGIAAGMAMMLLTRPPDLVLADFGRFLAARTPEGDYRVAAGAEKIHRSFLVSETGARLLPWPGRGDPAADGLDCAGDARCSYTAYGSRRPPKNRGRRRRMPASTSLIEFGEPIVNAAERMRTL